MSKIDVIRMLNSVGKRVFVEYYEDFQNLNPEDIMKRFPSHYKETGSKTRIYCAKKIFENHIEKEALQIIVNSKSDKNTIQKAKILLNQ